MKKIDEMTREEKIEHIINLLEKLGIIPPAPAQDPEEGEEASEDE